MEKPKKEFSRTPEFKKNMERCKNVLKVNDCEYEVWDETCKGDTCDAHSIHHCGEKTPVRCNEYNGWHAINYIIYCQDCVRQLFPEGIFYIGTKKIHIEKQ